MNTTPEGIDIRPWYREPWLWFVIFIPAATVVAGLATLWIALANPEYLAVDEQTYDEIRNEMRLDDESGSAGDDGSQPR